MKIVKDMINVSEGEITFDIENEFGTFGGLTITETLLDILAHEEPEKVMVLLRDLYKMTRTE